MEGEDFYLGPLWLIVIDKVCLLNILVWIYPHLLPSTNRLNTENLVTTIYPISTMPRSFKVRYIPCPVKSCNCQFTNQGGLKNHIRMHHTPKINAHLLAHELPMNDNGFPIDLKSQVLWR